MLVRKRPIKVVAPVTSSEILPALSKAEAEQITKEIVTQTENLWNLIHKAYECRIWVTLGYDNWDSYVKSLNLPMLPKNERNSIITSYRKAGMSQTAIASTTGISQQRVAQVLKTQSTNNLYPDADEEPEKTLTKPVIKPKPTQVTGTDGKTYPSHIKPRPRPKVEPPKFVEPGVKAPQINVETRTRETSTTTHPETCQYCGHPCGH